MRRVSWLLWLALFLTACPEDLPSYQRVVDMRVLAIRADPPAFLLGNPLVEGAESIDMSFSALVVDPRGRTIDYTWSFCPVESSRACADYEDRRLDAPAPDRPALDAMRTDLAEATQAALPLDQVVSPPNNGFAERAAWPYAIDDYTFTAPPELHTFHFYDSALGLGLGVWPSAVLFLESSGEQLLAAKRVVVGLRDLRGAAAQIASEVGATICPGEDPDPVTSPSQGPDCIVVRDPHANTNPVFVGVQLASGESALATDFRDLDINPDGTAAGPVTVRAGESIRVRPLIEQNQLADASDWQAHPEYHYQSLRVDLDSQELFVDDLFEEVSVSWFVTAGKVSDQLTWPKLTKTLDTAWTAPSAPPEDSNGRVTIWMVARDQRGGVGWMSVEILVLPTSG
jgi:hypothetical protein